jgi:hypothetical protein
MRQYLSRDKLKIQYTNYTVLTNLMSEEKKRDSTAEGSLQLAI